MCRVRGLSCAGGTRGAHPMQSTCYDRERSLLSRNSFVESRVMKRIFLATLVLVCTAGFAQSQNLTPGEARSVAKEATIYGFPLVDSYRVQYSYFVDRGGPEFKASWNTLVN